MKKTVVDKLNVYKISEIILVNLGAHEKAIFNAKSDGQRRTIRFKWGMILQVSNIIIPASDVSIPKSRMKYGLLDAKEVGNSSNSLLDHAYWCIFHQGVGESAELEKVADLFRSSKDNL